MFFHFYPFIIPSSTDLGFEPLLELQFKNVGLQNEQRIAWGGNDKLYQLINELTGLPSLPPTKSN